MMATAKLQTLQEVYEEISMEHTNTNRDELISIFNDVTKGV